MTIGKTSTCETHSVAMSKATVSIIHGDLPVITTEDQDKSKLFPHVEEPEIVFDSIGMYTGGTAVVYVCPECMKGKKKWREDYKEDRTTESSVP